ncbi:MAG: LssY C-terminal domain-containing protein [Deltaproteobacteria bacterium]|nr:LssY C-terminal domain-containing protein [Deltaproteobacteria bacterium]
MKKKTSNIRWIALLIKYSVILLISYGLISYFLLPQFWKKIEKRQHYIHSIWQTFTAEGFSGDPINLIFITSQNDLIDTFLQEGWRASDPIRLKSIFKMGKTLIEEKPYPSAPISPLFWQGRKEDFAFEKEVYQTFQKRHHIRFWRTDLGEGEWTMWLAAATFDQGFRFSEYTGQLLHRISPDIDRERSYVLQSMIDNKNFRFLMKIGGKGEMEQAKNGEGDLYFTDGQIDVLVLSTRGKASAFSPQDLSLLSPSWKIDHQFWRFFNHLFTSFL